MASPTPQHHCSTSLSPTHLDHHITSPSPPRHQIQTPTPTTTSSIPSHSHYHYHQVVIGKIPKKQKTTNHTQQKHNQKHNCCTHKTNTKLLHKHKIKQKHRTKVQQARKQQSSGEKHKHHTEPPTTTVRKEVVAKK
jgi:hypothetical protein